ncbi:MerR family transcriptional regulator [Paracoccaceae bacterium GXU_MW_L88]
MSRKSAEAFRTISEVSTLMGIPAHTLRYWESQFTQIKPVKRGGNRRYYRPDDIALLSGIRHLLHEEGLTIADAKRRIRSEGVRRVAGLGNLPEEIAGIARVETAPEEEFYDTTDSPRRTDISEVAVKPKPKPEAKALDLPLFEPEEKAKPAGELQNLAGRLGALRDRMAAAASKS